MGILNWVLAVHVDGVRLSLNYCHQWACRLSPGLICVHGEPWWNDIDWKTEELGERPVPVSLCPPQIPYAPTRASMVRGQ
jgi:hypothetical protein